MSKKRQIFECSLEFQIFRADFEKCVYPRKVTFKRCKALYLYCSWLIHHGITLRNECIEIAYNCKMRLKDFKK